MPELPEIEVLKRKLTPEIIGKKITNVILHRKNLRYPFPKDFEQTLNGQVIKEIKRRSKYLEIYLDNNYVWLTHFGMSGVFMLCEIYDIKEKNVHISLQLDNKWLHYIDPRRFGYMDILHKEKLLTSKYYTKLGPDPFDKQFTEDYLYSVCKKSKKPIKSLLIDSTFVAGIGNIYANEILFNCGVHPEQIISKSETILKKKEFFNTFLSTIQHTLNCAINTGIHHTGCFENITKNPAYFPLDFKIYGRRKEHCLKCRCQIKEIKISKRSTFFCPECQKYIK